MLVAEVARDHPAGRAEHPRGNGESLSTRLRGEDLNHLLVKDLYLRDSESERAFGEVHELVDYTTVGSCGSFRSNSAA